MLKTNAVKRISAFFLALMMILGTLPLNVFAEGLRGKEPGSVIVDSNTIKEEPVKEEKDSIAKSERHIISFNPNGGSGEMKSVEVEDGKNYTLPKNEFKAPEGKKFKSWTFEEDEQKEGYVLAVTRNLELKANWENIKKIDATTQSDPKVKEDASKEEDKLEVSENLASDAVGIANGEWLELSNEPGKTHKVRFTGFEMVDIEKGVVRVSIEGETNTTDYYNLYVAAPFNYDRNAENVVRGAIDFSKSKEENFDNINKALKESPSRKLVDILGSYHPTTLATITDDNTSLEIGSVKDGKVEITNLPENLKSIKYKVSTELNIPNAKDTLMSGPDKLKVYLKVSKEKAYILNYETPIRSDVIGDFLVDVPGSRWDYSSDLYVQSKGSIIEGDKRPNKINTVGVEHYEYSGQKLEPEIINGVERFAVLSSSGHEVKIKRGVLIPSEIVTKDKKLHYSIEIINPNDFNFTANRTFEDDVFIKEATLRQDEEKDIVKEVFPDTLHAKYADKSSDENDNIVEIRYGDFYNGKVEKELSGSKRVLSNVKMNKGNVSFDYFNEGEDLRSYRQPQELNILTFENSELTSVYRYMENKLTLSNLKLIKEDGSYDIPMYRIKVTRGDEVLQEYTTRLRGKLSIPSGSSFSDLYKITHEDREEVVEIPIETERIADDTMLKGEEKVVQQGEVGSKKVVYDVQFVDGKEYSKVEKSSKVIKPMKPRIIHYGTAEKLVNKTKETVKYDTIYEADQTLKYEEKKTTQQGKNGSKEITITTTLVSGKRQESKNEVVTVKPTPEIIKVGNKKVNTEKLPFKTIEQIDKTLKEGETKIKVKGVEGLKTTTTIYEVDKKTGKLINPKETVTTKNPVDQVVLKGTKPDSIKTSIEAKVKYFGVGGTEEKPEAGKYKFVLKDNKGKVVSEATNDKNGNIVFKELNITDKEIGSHKYTVEQVKGDDLTIEYDTHIEDVTVNVSLSDDNKLSAKVTYDKDGAVFGNRLNTTSIQFVRLAEGEKPFVAEEVKNDKGLVVSHKISDNDKAKTLDGAEYDIYKINSDGTETKVTSIKTENGISNLVENLLPGKYKLKETKAPKGYLAVSKDLEFEITKEDAGKALVKFASGEDNGAGGKIMEMPSTGGQGTKAFMIGGGVLLIVMAGVFVLANIKKKELNK